VILVVLVIIAALGGGCPFAAGRSMSAYCPSPERKVFKGGINISQRLSMSRLISENL